MYARDAACRALDITLDDVGPGRATLSMRVTDSMMNGHGIAHGGYIFLLADAAFAYACNSYGPVTVAQSAEVTFVRPVSAGDRLVAESSERTKYGRNGIYDVSVRNAAGETVAEFRGHSVTRRDSG
ncbi:MAG: hydroxyphenylacetyl-CoA thioesterase PaaI [Mycobacteriales bacterium]